MEFRELQNRTAPPLRRESLASLNKKCTQPLSRDTILSLNGKGQGGRTSAAVSPPLRREAAPRQQAPARPAPSPAPAARPAAPPAPPPPPVAASPTVAPMAIPALQHPLRKGQKTALAVQGNETLRVCFGWNVSDQRCDVDASAFLVDARNRVPGDEWFVFYGQVQSPEGSVRFRQESGGQDRESLSVDLGRLDPRVQKIVFVLTIDQAFDKNLHFGMLKDAYLRLLDQGGRELLSYRLEEYYPTVTSMTLGELYLHKGQWKFNPVGNGVHQDLAGQCAIYGVELC